MSYLPSTDLKSIFVSSTLGVRWRHIYLLWKTGLHDYGGSEVPWSCRCKQETRKAGGIIQFKGSNDVNSSPRAEDEERSQNNQWGRKTGMNFSSHLLFYSSCQQIGGCPPTVGRANLFLCPLFQMLFSSRNTFTGRNIKKLCLIWEPVAYSSWQN